MSNDVESLVPGVEVTDATVRVTARRSRRPPYPILDGVSLAVRKGGVVGLLGESGSGKTTLAKLLVGLIRPTSGTVAINGHDIWSLEPGERRKVVGRTVSMVFQDPSSSINPRLRIRRIIEDPLQVHGVGTEDTRTDRVNDLLEAVGLSAAMGDRTPSQLSGGQLQRVAIARSLALEPAVLVADEPTSALDVSVQSQVLNLLKDLRAHFDYGMLIISHDIRVIRYMTDETAVMYLGRLVEQGPTDALHNSPIHPYTHALLAAAPTVRRKHDPLLLEGSAPDPSHRPTGCPFRTRCWKATDICVSQPKAVVAGQHWAECFHPETSSQN